MRKFLILIAALLPACNAVNLKPNSLDKSETVYAQRGGYTMRFAAKQELEERGYKIVVGKATRSSDGDFYDAITSDIGDARYVLRVE